MYDLASFSLADKVACAAAIRELGGGTSGVGEAAERVVRFFYEQFVDPETGLPECALVRLYLTRPYAELDEPLQAFARGVLGEESVPPKTRCLTLVATAGEEPAWDSPASSVGHRAIPLASEQMVLQSPMIAQLITQLGLEVSQVLEPDPDLFGQLDERDYNVFFVPRAAGSPYIPAQEFVSRYRVESVLGFGGLLPHGDLFALILFAKVRIPDETARLFRSFALSLKTALLAAALAEGQ
jgi:hypothetical protein